MAATIKTKIRTTTGGTASTTAGELCVNTADKKIFIGDGAASVELANQIGYNTITTLGTISTGTWSATAIGATKGGTGQTTYATGDLIYSSASDTLSKLTKPAATSVLSMSSGGVPSWVGVTGTGSVPLSSGPTFDIGFSVQDTVGSQGAIIGFWGKDQFSSPAEYWGVYFGAKGTSQIPFTMYDFNDSTTYFQINGDKSIVIGDVDDVYDSTRISIATEGGGITINVPAGNLLINTTTPAVGKVLTCMDGNGTASWETPASGTPDFVLFNLGII